MAEYMLQPGKVDETDWGAVARWFGRKAHDVLSVEFDEGINFYRVEMREIEIKKSKIVLWLEEAAERKFDLPCEVFQAVRQHEEKLVGGYWLKVLTADRQEWTRFEYLGKGVLSSSRAINRLKV